MTRPRRAEVADLHRCAAALPEVTRDPADPAAPERPSYSVRGKKFVIFRGPRPDAVDPDTNERYADVVALHCSAADKEALVGDPGSPFFTTAHWNGYNAVLLLERDVGRLRVDELREMVTDAWLARAPKRLAADYLAR
ncbi:MAG: MmcQ/YjbR family DNA-binding protein [Humibacillus sp.]|nr:MmcQ/YjbR family DNA-binding protein [Humibacillus sp.]MDN5779091.1 MmcQ/YjbR family DNA-binding protein [Humibacillus sp.]